MTQKQKQRILNEIHTVNIKLVHALEENNVKAAIYNAGVLQGPFNAYGVEKIEKEFPFAYSFSKKEIAQALDLLK